MKPKKKRGGKYRRETKSENAFDFSLKNEKKINTQTVSIDEKCSPAKGIIRMRDKETTEIGNNYFVSVFINENEGH